MASPLAMTAARANWSSPPVDKEIETMDQDIPIRLTLGDTTLSLGATGHWELENAAMKQTIDQVRVLEKRNAALEAENVALQDKCARMTEMSSMEKFKCQLLVEMLAVSSLDEEALRVQAEQEKARALSLHADIVALLEQARVEGLDVRKFSVALGVAPPAEAPLQM